MSERKLTCWPPVQHRTHIWDLPPSTSRLCPSQRSYPPLGCSVGKYCHIIVAIYSFFFFKRLLMSDQRLLMAPRSPVGGWRDADPPDLLGWREDRRARERRGGGRKRLQRHSRICSPMSTWMLRGSTYIYSCFRLRLNTMLTHNKIRKQIVLLATSLHNFFINIQYIVIFSIFVHVQGHRVPVFYFILTYILL